MLEFSHAGLLFDTRVVTVGVCARSSLEKKERKKTEKKQMTPFEKDNSIRLWLWPWQQAGVFSIEEFMN